MTRWGNLSARGGDRGMDDIPRAVEEVAMEAERQNARRSRGWGRLGLTAGVALALGATVGLTDGGAFAPDRAGSSTAVTMDTAAWADDVADGFASVNALGQNGTYGGRGGTTVTVRTLADLEKYATAAEPYVIVVAGAVTMDPKGKEIKVASNKTIVGSGTAGQ
ncbi:hypothetical protein AB4212_66195, partial [Streptomyces sp. 2MCAF27]